jgi:hypothetical protein
VVIIAVLDTSLSPGEADYDIIPPGFNVDMPGTYDVMVIVGEIDEETLEPISIDDFLIKEDELTVTVAVEIVDFTLTLV